jgi:hypothetical protein
VAWNVLQQRESGSKLANKTGELRPEVSRVVGATALAGVGEGLAWISPDDEVRTQSVSVTPS